MVNAGAIVISSLIKVNSADLWSRMHTLNLSTGNVLSCWLYFEEDIFSSTENNGILTRPCVNMTVRKISDD